MAMYKDFLNSQNETQILVSSSAYADDADVRYYLSRDISLQLFRDVPSPTWGDKPWKEYNFEDNFGGYY